MIPVPQFLDELSSIFASVACLQVALAACHHDLVVRALRIEGRDGRTFCYAYGVG